VGATTQDYIMIDRNNRTLTPTFARTKKEGTGRDGIMWTKMKGNRCTTEERKGARHTEPNVRLSSEKGKEARNIRTESAKVDHGQRREGELPSHWEGMRNSTDSKDERNG